MLLVFLKTLKGHRLGILLAVVGLAGLGILLSISYQSIGEERARLFGEQMPRAFSALLKAEGGLILSSGFQGYVGIGFRHPLFLIVGSAFAIATAAGALAGEIERKTVLLLLARPFPRYRLVVSREAESMVGLALLVAALVAGVALGMGLAGLWDSESFGSFFIMAFNALCLFLAVCGYSYLISAMSSDGGRATLLATVLTVVFFFVDFMASLFEVLEPLGLLSVFHYYDPVSLAVAAPFPGVHVGVLLGVAAATFLGAVVVFQRRDIAV